MKCPVCPETQLVMTERQGVEIDYCPKCRGVWLDRGELDKIIERSSPMAAAAAVSGQPPVVHDADHRARAPYDDNDHHDGYKRRKSWLGELFD
jgi:Zn-finger nucleic acid-binding protein